VIKSQFNQDTTVVTQINGRLQIVQNSTNAQTSSVIQTNLT